MSRASSPDFSPFLRTTSHESEASRNFTDLHFLRGLSAMQGAFVVSVDGGADQKPRARKKGAYALTNVVQS
jgi:hypothetical protein